MNYSYHYLSRSELSPLSNLRGPLQGAEVIIFDSLTSIQRHSGYSPKDPEYGYWLYDLKDFASECQITPILAAHTNKAAIELGLDKVAGSYSITAAVSEIFMVARPTKPVDECDRVLVRVGSRSSGQSAWLIRLNLDDFSWEYKFPCAWDGGPIENDNSFTPDQRLNCRANVVEFLAQQGGKAHEAKEIAKAISANHHNVRKLCADLWSEGVFTRRKMGKAWVYSCKLPVDPLPSTPPEKESQKNCPMVQNDPLSQANKGFQVDHLHDPPPPDRSLGRATSDSPITSLSDRELAELVESDRHADS